MMALFKLMVNLGLSLYNLQVNLAKEIMLKIYGIILKKNFF